MERKYISVYQELANAIRQNVFEPGTLLPSEHELTEQFTTSRETVRKALNLLVHYGLIQKVRGKGSVVLDSQPFDLPVSGITSFKELTENMSIRAVTNVDRIESLPQDNDMHKKMDIPPDTPVWQVVRTREIAGEVVIVDRDCFIEDVVPKLSLEVCEQSIYEYVENELGLTIAFAHKEIVVELPTAEDHRLLSLNGAPNVVVIRSLVYLGDSSVFQYTESRHRLTSSVS
ncbi:trehalose operon repressor [Geomicrobium sp. JCM 19039]|uniref:trehalose operon repressor n=1 Tax=Geomicrobium sp. JCM 19039 TaxID=1460636 RepID=UPI00045F3DE1|nr:trehalose operon repressor [Geomicrobium sp. JCM 19039]GAK13886.1 trehalose operon transcriptional repressor [Geomicrobium sp. JCM 19039]